MPSPGDFLAVIPARDGSKSIPRKNTRDFLGKPLLAWTIETARVSGVFARVILSTEDQEIAEIGKAYGAQVPFRRPADLAQDTTPTAPVIRHTVEWLRDNEGWSPEYVMILEATSPSRRVFHIREGAELLRTSGADSVASVSVVPHHYNPLKILRRADDGAITGIQGAPIREMIHRRQDLPTYHAFNGLIFSCRERVLQADPPTLWGERVVGYVVDEKYNLDIDTPADWAVSEWRMRKILEEEKQA
jgi:CMP-N-acetylneuraminic acid synthetase